MGLPGGARWRSACWSDDGRAGADPGRPCAIANARAARSFAQALGYLEKTDRIDAEVIAFFTAQAKALATAIAALIDADPLWGALGRTLRSVKGVAGRTVATLLAKLPELGTLSSKAVTKLAGLAPLAHDSGKRQGPRANRGGRAAVRSILFLVADIARK